MGASVQVDNRAEQRILAAYLLFTFFSNFSTILYFLSLYLEHAGMSIAAISGFFFLYQASKLIGEVPTGYLADRFGRERAGIVGLAGMGTYYGLLVVLPTAPGFAAAFVIKGVALSFLSGSFESLYIDAVSKEHLVRYNVLERIAFYGSYACAALAGGWCASDQAYAVGLIIDMAMVACAAWSAIALCRASRLPKSEKTALPCEAALVEMRADVPEDAAGALGTGPVPATSGRFHTSFRTAGALILHNPVLPCLFLMDAAQAFSFVGIEDFYTLVLRRAGMTPDVAGVCIAIQLLLSSLLGLLVPRVLACVSEERLLAIAATARLIVSVPFLLPVMPMLFRVTCYIVQLLLYALFAPVKYAVFQNAAPAQYRCTMISVQSQMVSLGAIGFYAMSGVLATTMPIESILLVSLMLTAAVYLPALRRVCRSMTGK